MESINFLDTSAVLDGAYTKYQNVYISALVLSELENIKNSNKPEHIKYLARQAARDILNFRSIIKVIPNNKKIGKILKKFPFLTNIIDHQLICEAFLLTKTNTVNFVTKDTCQFLLAKQISNLTVTLIKDNQTEDYEYNGWIKVFPSEQQFIELYSDLTKNIFNCKINEFVEIYEEDNLKDILFWDGTKYRNLKYQNFTSVIGEQIKPRNLEQKMYLDLLQNKNIPVKLCIAKFGTGKSFLALNYALHEIQQGRFEKIIFVKNNLEVKGAGTLGTLPGDEVAKQYPWLRQIEDHIGIQKFEEYLANGIIEPAHLSTLRGRDLKNCIVLVDEAENLLSTNIQLLIGRMAVNSEIIFCADLKQCDYADETKSGIPCMIHCLKNHKLFGMVKLIKTERSETAAMADLMD